MGIGFIVGVVIAFVVTANYIEKIENKLNRLEREVDDLKTKDLRLYDPNSEPYPSTPSSIKLTSRSSS